VYSDVLMIIYNNKMGRTTVSFNVEDQQRYAELGIRTKFCKKIKQLLYDFLDDEELKRVDMRDKNAAN
tara:strand:+ start:1154 stop:1357 length:204 start_codon:yes stop_codon:yes gene_type:complete